MEEFNKNNFQLLNIEKKTKEKVGFFKILEFLSEECETSGGKKLALSLSSFDKIDEINYKQQETSEAFSFLKRYNSVSLGKINDINPLIERAKISSVLDEDEISTIRDTIKEFQIAKKEFLNIKEEFPILSNIANDIKNFTSLEEEISRCIDKNREIQDTASTELLRIRRERGSIYQQIQKILQEIINSETYQRIIQDKIITTRNERYVIPIKQEYKNVLPCIVQDQSDSGITLFVEPLRAVEYNNALTKLMLDEKREKQKILAYLTALINEDADSLNKSLEQVYKLDLALAKGRLSNKFNCYPPLIIPSLKTDIINLRNPFIENPTPIDVKIGDDYYIMVITGPNTGGKTVTLKSFGLAVLMAKSGLHILASERSQVGLYDKVLADIGDEQSIEQNLSTFSSHLSNIKEVLQNATRYSLVLLDELGSGTDPEEGSSLGISILDFLYRHRVTTVATTHFSKLKLFPYKYDNSKNACVGFDLESLSPTYKLLIGVPGQSHAFSIAERLGIDLEIINFAKKDMGEDILSSKTTLENISSQSEEIAKIREFLIEEELKLVKLKEEYEAKLIELDRKEKEELRDAHLEAQKIVDDVQRRMDEILKDFQESLKHSPKEAKELKEEVESKSEEISTFLEKTEEASTYTPYEEIKEGDLVWLNSFGKQGIIIEKVPSKKKLIVQTGTMRVTLQDSDVRKLTEEEIENQTKLISSQKSQKLNIVVPMKIDLHGLTIEEALEKLDKYIDQATLAGLPFVFIMHGKGSGTLKKSIAEFLKTIKSVSRFHYASPIEGGEGVTIVYFK